MSRFTQHKVVSDKWLVVSLPLSSSELVTSPYTLVTATEGSK